MGYAVGYDNNAFFTNHSVQYTFYLSPPLKSFKILAFVTAFHNQGEDESAEEKEEGIEGILSDVLDDEAVIKATLDQVKSDSLNNQPNPVPPKILDQWAKAKHAEANDEVVKRIDLDKMDLVEKMSQITQVNIRMCICSIPVSLEY